MRILILTLFYKPLNNIASTRSIAFKRYLEDLGHEVDVLTRHYSEENLKKSNLNVGLTESVVNEKSFYLKNDVIYTDFRKNNAKINFSQKLPNGIRGAYNLLHLDVYHYNFVENGLKAYDEFFSNKRHDIVIASCSPQAPLILASKIKEKYGVPWVPDFRDSFFMGNEKGLVKMIKSYSFNHFLNSSSGSIYVCEGMRDVNEKYLSTVNSSKPSKIIFNGFYNDETPVDSDVLLKFDKIRNKHQIILLFTGSMYPEANIDFYLNALKRNKSKNIGVVVVGTQKEFREKIKKEFSNLNVYFFDKVSILTSVELQKKADFLLVNIWKGFYTGFSGKIFEYLYSGSKILIDKDPANDLKKFLSDYNNITFCNENIDVFNKAIESNEQPISLTDTQRVSLSRKYQVVKLERFLLSLLD